MTRLPALPISPDPGAIPRTVHVIWVGGSLPDWATRSWERWQQWLPADFTLECWTDERVSEHPVLTATARVATYYDQPPRGQANLLRVVILALYGGIYADTDTVLADPGALPAWVGDRPPWVAAHRVNEHKRVLDNGCFGMPAGHPFLAAVLSEAQRNLEREVHSTHAVSGPPVYRKVWERPEHREIQPCWVWEVSAPREISRAFYTGESLPALSRSLTTTVTGQRFPVLHVAAETPAEKGYGARGGSQQPLEVAG